jgi:hypothetical protein
MTTAIGANIFGFIAGITVFALHAILFGISQLSNIARELTLPEGILYLFVGSLAIILIIGVLFWMSSVLVVFPVYLILRTIPLPALVVSGLSACLAAMPVWFFLESPGVGNNLAVAVYSACISSPLVTGAITGYMLVRIMKKQENKPRHDNHYQPFR